MEFKLKFKNNRTSMTVITLIFIQIFAVVPLAHSGIKDLKEGDVLKLTKANRYARSNADSFSRHNKKNVIKEIQKLPAGSKVRYTGVPRRLKNGNYGIQVELLSGVKEEYKGKLVWIYYKKHERTIELDPTEQNSNKSPINEADITDIEDFIRVDESYEEFIGQDHAGDTSVEDVSNGVELVAETLNKVGIDTSTNNCRSKDCKVETDAEQANSNTDSEITKEITAAIESETARDNLLNSGIPQLPLLRALQFYNANKDKRNLQDKYLIVADLTQSSNKKRMYKIDLETGKVIKYTTSHGRGYSNAYDCAHAFGNRSNSYLSAGGGYVTGPERKFKGHGALSLHGVEEGLNDKAYKRGILLHRGSYVSDNQAGRTLGCLTIANKYADDFIDSLQGFGSNKGHIEKGAAIYIYPARDDLRNKNSYWDPSCQAKLNSRDRVPRWVN
jgi:hypothetical protein